MRVGDEMIISSPLDQIPSIGFPHRLKTIVNGIFHSQILDYDDRIIFLPAETGELIFSRLDRWDGVDLRIHSDINIDDARKRMIEACSYENVCLHWYDFFVNMDGVEDE